MAEQTKLTERRTLEKAYLDWRSVKTQMSAAAVLIVASVWLSYLPTLRLGFMGHDFSRLANLIAHGPDLGCLPTAQLSLWLNFILGHTHSGLYHAFNIIFFSVCAVLVGLITLEFTGRQGNRQGAIAALWAGLLFSVYPLGQGAVAAIGERPVLIGLCFYLAAIYTFQRFLLLKESIYLKLSLTAALLAVTSTPAAVTLPLVISALGLDQNKTSSQNARYIWPYFLMAATAFAFNETRNYLSSCTTFDINPWHLFLANNETLISTKKLLLPGAVMAGAAALTVVLRVCLKENNRPQLADAPLESSATTAHNRPWELLAWLGLTIITTASGLSPAADLADGSRYIFVAAPFCSLLAFLLSGRCDMKKSQEKILLTLSILPLAGLYIFWSAILAANLKPWQDAAAVMGLMRHQIQLACQGGEVKLLDLPQEISGVPYFLSDEELAAMLRPPFCGQDLSGRAKMIKAGDSTSGRGNDTPGPVSASVSASAPVLAWINHSKDGLVTTTQASSQAENFEVNFCDIQASPQVRQLAEKSGFIIEQASQWHPAKSGNKIELTGGYARIVNESYKPVVLWLPWRIGATEPRSQQSALSQSHAVLLQSLEMEGLKNLINPEFTLVWREVDKEPTMPESGIKTNGAPIDLGALPGFTSSTRVKEIGLKIEPRQTLIFRRLRLRSGDSSNDRQ